MPAVISETLYSIKFTPSLADPVVWFKAACRPYGVEYYQYILVYVDDLLVLSHDAKQTMETVRKAYRLKDKPSEPITYLGATIKKWSIPGECRPVWGMNSQCYIKEAIRCLEIELALSGLTLKGHLNTPMQP
jgi:hypothetical protein